MAFPLAYAAWLSITGESVIGEVVSYRSTAPRSNSRGGSSIVVSFQDKSGRAHSVTPNFALGKRFSGKSRKTHEIGEKVRILYPHNKPQDAVIADRVIIAWQIFIALFLAMFTMAGLLIIRYDIRKQREDGWAQRRYY